ncbi:MAG: sigma-54-dependent Fis family transcriptional regulator [Acidobacteria bacterium]|nr:sigma-54-dependent Fis family transcriptional regulator [Acidobacteriota bacterium]
MVMSPVRTPRLIRVLVAEDDAGLRRSLTQVLSQEGYDVISVKDGNDALKVIAQQPIDLVLSDLKMPGIDGMELLQEAGKLNRSMGVILLTAYATVDVAVEAMKHGAFDFVTKPVKKSVLLAVVRNALEKQALIRENSDLKIQLDAYSGSRQLIATSQAMRRVLELVEQVAPTSSTVLITGESGTGKELVAEEIHHRSGRADHPLVKVSCAALPEAVIESELFGHEKGAFTGAVARHVGRFEIANGGTLFLDEIGEAPLQIQVKLLRVLQDGRFERIGGTQTLFSDARIIAATNRDLKAAISQGQFREDLYYRLNVIGIHIPPLRERQEEIPLVTHHFLEVYRLRCGKPHLSFTDAFLDGLMRHSWPGNIRELENVVERAVIMARGTRIDETLLPDLMQTGTPCRSMLSFPLGSTLDEIEERAIEDMLEHTRGEKELAAKLLGIAPRTIYRFLERKRKLKMTNCHSNPSNSGRH